jgi:hypothetical protein
MGVPAQEPTMAEVASASNSSLRPLLWGAVAAGMMLAGAIALWAHYGSAVFFEMIRAGIALCF